MAFGEKILGFLTGAGGMVDKGLEIINKRVEDKDLARKLEADFRGLVTTQAFEIERAAQDHEAQLLAGQIDLNKTEATTDKFRGGWRPFIGWVSGASLAAYFLPQYAMGSYLWVRLSLLAIDHGEKVLPPYPVTTSGLMELTLGMLGLAGMRTAERFRGKA